MFFVNNVVNVGDFFWLCGYLYTDFKAADSQNIVIGGLSGALPPAPGWRRCQCNAGAGLGAGFNYFCLDAAAFLGIGTVSPPRV